VGRTSLVAVAADRKNSVVVGHKLRNPPMACLQVDACCPWDSSSEAGNKIADDLLGNMADASVGNSVSESLELAV
jgi:hypothetical protein